MLRLFRDSDAHFSPSLSTNVFDKFRGWSHQFFGDLNVVFSRSKLSDVDSGRYKLVFVESFWKWRLKDIARIRWALVLQELHRKLSTSIVFCTFKIPIKVRLIEELSDISNCDFISDFNLVIFHWFNSNESCLIILIVHIHAIVQKRFWVQKHDKAIRTVANLLRKVALRISN